MITFKKENDEVLYPTEDIIHISKEDIQNLKSLAIKNPRKRVRLCAHENPNSSLHEMFIVHMKDCYVTPHKHLGKSESMAVLEGEVDIVLFNEDGSIKRIVEMGDLNRGKLFYQRLSSPVYHTLIIRSEFLVFHEVTEGPFLREKTVFAPWAPPENSPKIVNFINEIEMYIKKGSLHE